MVLEITVGGTVSGTCRPGPGRRVLAFHKHECQAQEKTQLHRAGAFFLYVASNETKLLTCLITLGFLTNFMLPVFIGYSLVTLKDNNSFLIPTLRPEAVFNTIYKKLDSFEIPINQKNC